MANPYVEYENIIPLLSPADITTSATNCNFMDLANAHDAGFYVYLGAVSSASTDAGTITVLACSVGVSDSEAAVAFQYRLSGTLGANTWGAITAVSADSSAPLAVGSDGMIMYIHVDPSAIEASSTSVRRRYARVLISPTASFQNCVVCVLGATAPRFKQTTFVTAIS